MCIHLRAPKRNICVMSWVSCYAYVIIYHNNIEIKGLCIGWLEPIQYNHFKGGMSCLNR